GMRRLVEDDVRKRCGNIEERVPFEHKGPHPWGKNRPLEMPVELTSREKAGAIKEAKDRLNRPHAAKEHVDVLLASNMISVGVDIDRPLPASVPSLPRRVSPPRWGRRASRRSRGPLSSGGSRARSWPWPG